MGGVIGMGAAIRSLSFIASAILMVVLQAVTLLAMIIAPKCTGIGDRASLYKITSIVVFSMAYYILALRRASLVAAIIIPLVQVALGWWFLGYINSLPMTCP